MKDLDFLKQNNIPMKVVNDVVAGKANQAQFHTFHPLEAGENDYKEHVNCCVDILREFIQAVEMAHGVNTNPFAVGCVQRFLDGLDPECVRKICSDQPDQFSNEGERQPFNYLKAAVSVCRFPGSDTDFHYLCIFQVEAILCQEEAVISSRSIAGITVPIT